MSRYKKVPAIKAQLEKAQKKAMKKKIEDRINWNMSHLSPKAIEEVDKAILAHAKMQGVQIIDSKKI